MDGDSGEPLSTMNCPKCALVMPDGSTWCPKCGWGKSSAPPAIDWDDVWDLIKGFLALAVLVGGVCWGVWAGAKWVRDQFETADSVGQKATKCWAETEKHPWKVKECAELTDRADALEKREKAEQFCKDKGLKFKGTIGDQVECEP